MSTYLMDKEGKNGKFIPATQRPDGTWRKARRVKEGYVPQEEVPLYESKGKKFSESRAGMYPPGYSPNGVDPLLKERNDLIKAKAIRQIILATTTTNKTTNHVCSSSSSATLPALANDPKENKNPTSIPAAKTGTGKSQKPTKSVINKYSMVLDDMTEHIDVNDAQMVAKQLKKLRKKMREIETIVEKMESGELKKPEIDQVNKVKRKLEIQEEIERFSDIESRLAAVMLDDDNEVEGHITTNNVPPMFISQKKNTSCSSSSSEWVSSSGSSSMQR